LKTKLFGSGGIEDGLKKDLGILLETPDEDLGRIATWLLETPRPIPLTWSDIAELVEGTSLDPRTANRVLVVLRYLLTNWRTYDLTLDEIQSDLKAVGYSDPEVAKVTGFLSKLKDARERVFKSAVRRTFETRGAPTIDDVNLMWDVRPMFQGPAYDVEPQGKAFENLVGHTHLLILEITGSSQNGIQESRTYQLSEDDFDRFCLAFERAKKQLEIVKKTFV